MLNYIIRRLLYMLVTLVFVAIISFMLLDLTPGSYLDTEIARLRQAGGNMSDGQIEALKIRYGVNDPFPLKFGKWIVGVLQGDFGQSFEFSVPVSSLIWGRLAFSLILATSSIIFAWLISIPLGVYSATHRYTIPDYIITVLQFVGVAIPEFLIALVLMVVSASVFHADVGGLFSPAYVDAAWSGAKFVDFLKHVWIPIIVIGASSTAWLTRVMRANLLDVLNAQYVQTARAKGLGEGLVIWKHAVRNALHPLIMAAGGILPALISGEVIASIVLNLPTTGPLFINALIKKDTYLAVAFLLLLSVMLVVGNLLADLALAWVDPRIRLE
ncbi:MAG: ABC transporter permease [Herpetosiphonaceae bacterium]|nr:ABC transporter permease [Herpetosiphonaceae bacterium]